MNRCTNMILLCHTLGYEDDVYWCQKCGAVRIEGRDAAFHHVPEFFSSSGRPCEQAATTTSEQKEKPVCDCGGQDDGWHSMGCPVRQSWFKEPQS